MTGGTDPAGTWDGEFGKEWTERNPDTVEELDNQYQQKFGQTRTALNEQFLGEIETDARVLEVGCNTGVQLKALRELGFESLYGIDVMEYVIRETHRKSPELNVIEGDVLDIPFKTNFFDLVFTSGTLIHVPPSDIDSAMREIARCADTYVWGYEYYAEEYVEIDYRDHENLLWKTDFPERFEVETDLELVATEYLEYPDSDNRDVMYLLKHS
ncbi:pseudaminic acid biosynthesis-associated methylase [Halosimplex sp. TS25]|uniref:pseudaminic acid biosynthesis-associated methylase n=1 Tax=Halosimplex rarum TaxID=3396619 RepID=UPI0039E8C7C6